MQWGRSRPCSRHEEGSDALFTRCGGDSCIKTDAANGTDMSEADTPAVLGLRHNRCWTDAINTDVRANDRIKVRKMLTHDECCAFE
jgi:hypothetical protein